MSDNFVWKSSGDWMKRKESTVPLVVQSG